MKRFTKTATLCIVMTLVAALFCAPAQALGTTPTHHIAGNASIGEGVGKQTTVVDFAGSDLCGFAPFAGTEALTFGSSAAWGTNVLKTHLASPAGEMGIQKTMSDTSLLKNASTLSVQTVAQASSYLVTLRLTGVDKNGAPLSFEAHTPVTTNHWQTVTFDISAFADLANTDAPVTVTLLACAQNEESIGADWMIKSLYLCSFEALPEYVLPAAAAGVGLLFGFTLFFVIYRSTCKKNRRRSGEGR